MQSITTIGLDIAKSVFQVHGVDAGGQVVIRRQLKRRHVRTFFEKLSPCLVGIEACASSHHWSRELQALGHTVRLMPPASVKPLVKRQKNDATDAEANCKAITRANLRFVRTKISERRTDWCCTVRAICSSSADLGDQCNPGPSCRVRDRCAGRRHGVEELLKVVADPNDKRVPEIARACLSALGVQLREIKEQILEFDRLIRAWHRSNEMSMRLDEAPGVGPVLATAVVAAVVIQTPSDQGATSRPGSVSYRSSTRVGARTGSAISASKVTAICAACLWLARFLSSVTPRSMAPNIGHGSRPCWCGGRPRLLLSRSPTRSREWSGP